MNRLSRQTYALSNHPASLVRTSLEAWRTDDKIRRLWARDATLLWTGTNEAEWLGWLETTKDREATTACLQAVADEIKSAGFTHALRR